MNDFLNNDQYPEGVNPVDLLRQGILEDTCNGELRHLFHSPSVEILAPIFFDLDIIELIGEGGMGAVYKARQCELDRFIALKILPEEIGDDLAFSEQFSREAKALAKLNHPNIISIHEFGTRNGLCFIIMEYVDGTNLRQIMEQGLIAPQDALSIVSQICDALQYAHDQGVVHRDIKPENILINREGVVKVADFGLAKLIPSQQQSVTGDKSARKDVSGTVLSRDGKVMGTPAYMAPEQLKCPSDVDRRVDIYALGVVFYQMLTGGLPGERISSSSLKVLKASRLDGIVLKALERNPAKRYQQASIMKTSLETGGNGISSSSFAFSLFAIAGIAGAAGGGGVDHANIPRGFYRVLTAYIGSYSFIGSSFHY